MLNLVIAILAAASTVSSEAPATEAAAAANTEATSTEKAEVPEEERQPAAKPKKICRTVESDTGSRTGGGKVCKTAEGWKKYYGQ